jgi:hypothetical protein
MHATPHTKVIKFYIFKEYYILAFIRGYIRISASHYLLRVLCTHLANVQGYGI